jgi:hypothetical protein
MKFVGICLEEVRKITENTYITTAVCGSTPKTGTSGMVNIRVFFHDRVLAVLAGGWLWADYALLLVERHGAFLPFALAAVIMRCS